MKNTLRCLFTALATTVTLAHAASPEKPIKIGVGFSPKSSTNSVARALEKPLSLSMGLAFMIKTVD